MKKAILLMFLLFFLFAGSVNALLIVDNSTQGYYNQSIATSLDLTNFVSGTDYLFPGPNISTGDPTFNPVPFEPNLSTADSALGNWLTDPGNLNTNWSGLQNIPLTWTVNHETAIIYELYAGDGLQYEDVFASFGVDNGMFVWLDGNFLSGWLRPGGSTLGEHTLNLGSLGGGTHYLQILREDHGVATGYSIAVQADIAPVPEPTTILLLGTGLIGLVGLGRKRGFLKK